MIYRPTRERDIDTLKNYAYKMLESTGHEEIVIPPGDLFRQLRDGFHIFFCLGRKSQHEIKFHLIPSALERLS